MGMRLTGKQQEVLRKLTQQHNVLTPEQGAEQEAMRAKRTAELESYQPGPDFKVRITSLPNGGSEFYFPPTPFQSNAPTESIALLVMVCIISGVSKAAGGVATGVLAALLGGGFLIGALYIGLLILTPLLFFRVLRLWFAAERVTIANGILSDTSGLFRRTRTMPIAEIVSIHAMLGSTAKHSSIFVRGSGLQRLIVGDGIRERDNADWLAMQMSRAAGIKPSASLPGDEIAEIAGAVEALEERMSPGQLRMMGNFEEKMDALREQQMQPAIPPDLQAFPETGGDGDGKPSGNRPS